MSGPRERLLAAALHLVSEKGYLGATTRMIAAAAGVSELTLFRQFGTKGALFGEVLRHHTFLPRLRTLLLDVEGLPCEEALRKIAVRYLETLGERRDLVKIMLAEGHTYPVEIREAHAAFITEMEATLAGYLEILQGSGALRGFSAPVAARTFLRTLFATFTVEEIVRGRKITPARRQRIATEFVDLFLNGLAARPGRGRGTAGCRRAS